MIFYPTRKQISIETYRERCVGGEVWQFIDDLMNGRRMMLFLPGSLSFGAVGFLIVIPAISIFLLLLDTSFKNETPAFQGIFMMASGVVFVTTHGIFMMLTSLGFLYAQQDLVRYLSVLKTLSLLCLMYGFFASAQTFVLLLSAAGFATATLMSYLARSLSFTLFADLMRVKRLYYQHKKQLTQS